MSGQATVDLDFGGENRTFGCGLGMIRRVQDKCDAGPGEIVRRLAPYIYYARERDIAQTLGKPKPDMLEAIVTGRIGEWRADDIREPIFQGLVFGGMPANDAGKLVRQYIDESKGGLLESLPIAFSILTAALTGVEDETAGELEAGQGQAEQLSPAASTGSSTTGSTPSEPPPASIPA